MTYPYRTPPVPAHLNCVRNQMFDLHLIIHDIIRFCCPAEQEEHNRNSCSYPELEKMVNSFYDRLSAWNHHVPVCLKQRQSWTPGVIELQCVY
jgi:hypothetical protein